MSADPLSTTFAALADPTRRGILQRLTQGECSVTELAQPYDMTMPAITRHLKVLERAGLVERSRRAQWRPCRLKAESLKPALDYMEQYKRHWDDRLDRLDEFLNNMQAQEHQEGN